MKSNILKFSSLILLGMSSPVFAAVGTIYFSGAVQSSTCSAVITDGGATGRTDTVQLPTVRKSLLATSGSTAGLTAFTLKLTDGAGGACTDGATPTAKYAVPYFSSTSTNIDGRLPNLDFAANGGATNVDIQILKSDGNTTIDYTEDAATQTASTSASTAGTYSYAARYYATDVAIEGTVRASIDYNIIYK